MIGEGWSCVIVQPQIPAVPASTTTSPATVPPTSQIPPYDCNDTISPFTSELMYYVKTYSDDECGGSENGEVGVGMSIWGFLMKITQMLRLRSFFALEIPNGRLYSTGHGSK
mgnify:CR=1 FL=1